MPGFFDTLGRALGQGLESRAPSIPVLGPLLYGNPEQEAHEQQFRDLSQVYEQYRPEVFQARLQAMRQAMGAFQPYNQLLGQMYGPQFQTDMSQFWQNPFQASPGGQSGTRDMGMPRGAPRPTQAGPATGGQPVMSRRGRYG